MTVPVLRMRIQSPATRSFARADTRDVHAFAPPFVENGNCT